MEIGLEIKFKRPSPIGDPVVGPIIFKQVHSLLLQKSNGRFNKGRPFSFPSCQGLGFF